MAFSYLVPVEDLGIPRGYKSTRAAWRAAIQAEAEEQTRTEIRRNRYRLNEEDRYENHAANRRDRRGNQAASNIISDEQRAQDEAYTNMDLGLDPEPNSGLDVQVDRAGIINDVQDR
eukprot:CAMPEP_0205813194 /NCGR_PEP_ID=MMETSP0205-20121125/17835_1 /ASSEMBLY_ACC=CAM_ASM_000278 /TAXON_ID=36767 /ORGANISM="Euplotes focardii, Strain TN1" /LENGTH=116 /DNA_ID=CAMNT_0053095003 /DNA_START=257 /DNA_END=604 /DNA_ORIENTATION=+